MRTCIILAGSEATAAALEAFWSLVQPCDEASSFAPRAFVMRGDTGDAVKIHDQLVRQIRDYVDDRRIPPARGVVLVDYVSLSQLNPFLGDAWSAAIAMLILTFPELRWIFGVAKPDGRASTDYDGLSATQLTSLLGPEKDAVFDFSGLRDFIRQAITEHQENGNRVAPGVPHRKQFAIAMDDEISYAYFHSYVAHRFGFRALPIMTEAVAKEHLTPAEVKPKPNLVFEDIFIDFPDKIDSRIHYSDLEGDRESELPALNMARNRIFVTTGQRHGGDQIKHLRNRDYMNRKPGINRWRRQVFKPLGGLFDLWQQAQLDRHLKWSQDGRTYQGTGEEFIWPPPMHEMSSGTGHSAPGRLLVIAQSLIDRCHRLMADEITSVPDAVRGAVLATHALELLGDRTPTTGLEALALKHRFEVLTECLFSGVEYHILIRPRLTEIRTEIAAVGRWFARHKRRDAVLNAEMTIVNALVRIFRENNQFDEELICMNRVRHLHNSLWMRQKPWRLVMWPLLRYLELLLASFSGFIGIIFLWVILLAMLYCSASHHSDWTEGLASSISSFFSLGEPVHHGEEVTKTAEYVGVICLAIVAGFVHVGVFISHLYSIIARK